MCKNKAVKKQRKEITKILDTFIFCDEVHQKENDDIHEEWSGKFSGTTPLEKRIAVVSQHCERFVMSPEWKISKWSLE